MIRLSIGIEHVEDIWQDIEQALNLAVLVDIKPRALALG